MNTFRSRVVGPTMLLAAALVLAGCSYTPARVKSEPLIEIDGHHGGYHRRHDHYDDDHDDHWDYYGRDRERHYDGRRYRDRHDYRDRDRQRSRFCPPGQAKQGRC
ncbi:hypothetical protein [Halomonas nitroreducens]|uniref:Lipoprotein n=1 Tax=Halomonas nitroreducens TaxID=447425 RepID=A0A3S0IA57_9GAMM|nr:hypothetical protein [Halomonas nitroreducens]RTR06532.1 hypothetical protein EKG36_03415 [Halomonas nitroreducens]